MRKLSEEIAAADKQAGRLPFGRGTITRVDTSGEYPRYTVRDLPMRACEVPAPALAVGDEVAFADVPSPFIIGRLET